MLTSNQVCERLEENNLGFYITALSNNYTIIVTQYGGRILGPFKGDSESCCWINPVFQDRTKFKQFVSDRSWNIGGDRIWLEPELQFNVPAPSDFWNSYTVPGNLDPGHYTLEQDENRNPVLKQEMELSIFRESVKKKRLHIERTISSASHPVPHIDVDFCGYHHDIILQEHENDGIIAEAWNLLQIKPKGSIYIPTTHTAEFVDYYEPITPEYHSVTADFVTLKIDAKLRYKVGYSPLSTLGRSGYVSRYKNTHYLMIRNYFNDPAGMYPEPYIENSLKTGASLHIYNDDGKMGDFAEHECSCLPIGGNTGRGKSHNRISTLFFWGEDHVIQEIAKLFLGIDVKMPVGM